MRATNKPVAFILGCGVPYMLTVSATPPNQRVKLTDRAGCFTHCVKRSSVFRCFATRSNHCYDRIFLSFRHKGFLYHKIDTYRFYSRTTITEQSSVLLLSFFLPIIFFHLFNYHITYNIKRSSISIWGVIVQAISWRCFSTIFFYSCL